MPKAGCEQGYLQAWDWESMRGGFPPLIGVGRVQGAISMQIYIMEHANSADYFHRSIRFSLAALKLITEIPY